MTAVGGAIEDEEEADVGPFWRTVGPPTPTARASLTFRAFSIDSFGCVNVVRTTGPLVIAPLIGREVDAEGRSGITMPSESIDAPSDSGIPSESQSAFESGVVQVITFRSVARDEKRPGLWLRWSCS